MIIADPFRGVRIPFQVYPIKLIFQRLEPLSSVDASRIRNSGAKPLPSKLLMVP